MVTIGKGKAEHLYSASHCIQTTQAWITQFNLQRSSRLPLPRKLSPDGASTNWGSEHLIAAHSSFIDPVRMKAELTRLADLQQTIYPHKWSPISWRSSVRQGKFAGPARCSCHCVMSPTNDVWDSNVTTWHCALNLWQLLNLFLYLQTVK